MARKIFVAATGQNCGKTTTSISLLYLAQANTPHRLHQAARPQANKFPRAGPWTRMPPSSPRCFNLTSNLRHMSPVVLQPDTTRRMIDGEINPAALEDKILQAYAGNWSAPAIFSSSKAPATPG
jgi:uncharacterized protein